jgi:antimicrobial peptide system SdpA family protein
MKRLLFLLKGLVVIFWLFLFFFALTSYLPDNPLSPGIKSRVVLKTFLAEDWGFFTKSPRDLEMFIYAKKENIWESILFTPNSSYKNIIGIDRRARAQGSEAALLLNDLQQDSSKWIDATNVTHLELMLKNEGLSPVSVENKSKRITLIGDVWVILQRPIPWSWSEHLNEIKMPLRAIRLNIKPNH